MKAYNFKFMNNLRRERGQLVITPSRNVLFRILIHVDVSSWALSENGTRQNSCSCNRLELNFYLWMNFVKVLITPFGVLEEQHSKISHYVQTVIVGYTYFLAKPDHVDTTGFKGGVSFFRKSAGLSIDTTTGFAYHPWTCTHHHIPQFRKWRTNLFINPSDCFIKIRKPYRMKRHKKLRRK